MARWKAVASTVKLRVAGERTPERRVILHDLIEIAPDHQRRKGAVIEQDPILGMVDDVDELVVEQPRIEGVVDRADAGVAAVALHGRTAAQFYSGQADWTAIARLREALPDIPVLGNGDIFSADDVLFTFSEERVRGKNAAIPITVYSNDTATTQKGFKKTIELFRELEAVVGPAAVLATTPSSVTAGETDNDSPRAIRSGWRYRHNLTSKRYEGGVACDVAGGGDRFERGAWKALGKVSGEPARQGVTRGRRE